MRPILEEPFLDFHKYSQRPIQISEFSKEQKEGVEPGAKSPLSLIPFVLSFETGVQSVSV
jgi:hypothetical protein